MWVIVVLLLISFTMFALARIARTERMFRVFSLSGLAIWFVVAQLGPKNGLSCSTMMGFLVAAYVISDLVARPIWRRRLMPPCVRVRMPWREGVFVAFISLLGVAFLILLLVTGSNHSSELDLFFGLLVAAMLIELFLQYGKTEICGNGVWQDGGFQPWTDYEYFSWKKKAKDGVELKLVMKSGIWPSTRLMVLPEDREAVHQLLTAHLTDLSTADINS